MTEEWIGTPSGLIWDLSFDGEVKRTGHEVTIDLPVLSPGLKIFTPSDDEIMDVAAVPTYRPVPYAHMGWDTGQAYVLPLVTVMDPKTDQALTVALPPDRNIPHLQVEWIGAKTLRLTLAHRAMGEARPRRCACSSTRIRPITAARLKAYSDDFPAYFRPVVRHAGRRRSLLVSPHPGPSGLCGDGPAERALHVVELLVYASGGLPAGRKGVVPVHLRELVEIRQTMSDDKINAFIRDMRAHGISVYAYFNVTEYGGAGDKSGDSVRLGPLLKENFADALVKDVAGQARSRAGKGPT